MESIILAFALCGHPATCHVPPVNEVHVAIHTSSQEHVRRRPVRRGLRGVARAVRFLRPFRRGCRR